uniref:Uncharacterized protein n=1 Tax=Pseudo-nitzschia australis TaxID=44445 RepID=A0A7S4AMF3_9STRA|mmetsp:Transcript_23155/g.50591  ORF Transcript_23155/g.50591 Transcript_23155/m.50591 type:complete len:242 (-) Transcript_23155:725-1450(-)
MAFGLTSAAIAEFAAKPFIRHALACPRKELSVRSFFFGIDCAAPNLPDLLGDGKVEKEMAPFWYSGHEEYDKLCCSFKDVIREAGRNELPTDEEWGTIDGRFARILLCDQLSRNCFRGTEEAFLYDGVALDLAKEMSLEALSSTTSSDKIPGMYAYILALPLMHSESIPDHELCLDLLKWGKERSPNLNWELNKGFVLQHTEVLQKFGHYPHRNSKKGRATTPEEENWLASPDCPVWAKSQ